VRSLHPDPGKEVTVFEIAVGVVAVGLLIYLLVAMFKPEWF
jgi:K+-transporting ATPase KdpF subunit